MFFPISLLISIFYCFNVYVQLMPLMEKDQENRQNSTFDRGQGAFIMNFEVNISKY